MMGTTKKLILFMLLYGCVGVLCHPKQPKYVDPMSTCLNGCGSSLKPYSSILEALRDMKENPNWSDCEDDDYIEQNWYGSTYSMYKTIANVPVLILKSGTYTGENNVGIPININVDIISTTGANKTIIDCQNIGRAFKIANIEWFSLSGVTITRCFGNIGGALSLSKSKTSLTDIIFKDNKASMGGAIAIDLQSSVIERCQFINNTAMEMGSDIYVVKSNLKISDTKFICKSNSQSNNSITCNNGTITIDTLTNLNGVLCINGCKTVQGYLDKCNSLGPCSPAPTTTPTPTITPNNSTNSTTPIPTPTPTITPNNSTNSTTPTPGSIDQFGCLVDGKCDIMNENCLNCPQDCHQCQTDGFKLQTFEGCIATYDNTTVCPSTISLIRYPSIINYLPEKLCPVSGILSTYFTVPQNYYYTFRVTGSNIGVKLSIDGNTVINSFYTQKIINSTYSQRLNSDNPHILELVFFSVSSEIRNITLEWSLNQIDFIPIDGFISRNICNDGILDEDESNIKSKYYCYGDLKSTKPGSVGYCGDGICTEVPEECLEDCYMIIAPNCPGQSPPSTQGILKDGEARDTMGALLANQYLYTLPSVHMLRHGIDLLTGKPKTSPLFQFNYCDNTSFSIVQDFNRDMVYTVPKEVQATVTPSCSYDEETVEFSSSVEMKNDMAEKSGISYGGSLSGGNSFVSLAVEMAYSKDDTVERAKEMESRNGGKLFKTEIKCISTKMSLVQTTFNEGFLRDLSKVRTYLDTIPLLEKYGNLYIKDAVMGGSLSQITIVNDDYGSNKDSKTLKEHISLSYSSSLRSPFFSVTATQSETMDSSISNSQQATFEANSERSTVITQGGPPGAYSPSEKSQSYQKWASKVDLIPVPIQYNLGFIFDIIPENWKTSDGQYYLRDLWMKGEVKWLYDINPNPNKPNISMIYGQVTVQIFDPIPIDLVISIILIDEKNTTTNLIYDQLTTYYDVPSVYGGFKSIIINTTNVMNFLVTSVPTSRGYIYLNERSPSNKFTPMEITLIFNDISEIPVKSSPDIEQYLEITVFGTSDRVTHIIGLKVFHNERIGSSIIITIPNTNRYIGKITKVGLYLWSTVSASNTSFQFKSLIVLQSCGDFIDGRDPSGCTPPSKDITNVSFTQKYFALQNNVTIMTGILNTLTIAKSRF